MNTNIYNRFTPYTLANKWYVLVSRTICLTDDTAPTAASAEDTTAMVVFIQKTRLFLEGLKLTL